MRWWVVDMDRVWNGGEGRRRGVRGRREEERCVRMRRRGRDMVGCPPDGGRAVAGWLQSVAAGLLCSPLIEGRSLFQTQLRCIKFLVPGLNSKSRGPMS